MLQFLLSVSDRSDHEKIEYVYHQYHKQMLRFARSRLRQMRSANCDLDAEDVVQNAFVKIVRHIDKIDFSMDEREVRGYIMRIVANEAIIFMSDVVYSEDITQYADYLSDGSFLEKLRIEERFQEVITAIKNLDERYSYALSLRYVENMPIKDIAAMLGIAEKSVYTRIERGRRKLLEALQEKTE